MEEASLGAFDHGRRESTLVYLVLNRCFPHSFCAERNAFGTRGEDASHFAKARWPIRLDDLAVASVPPDERSGRGTM